MNYTQPPPAFGEGVEFLVTSPKNFFFFLDFWFVNLRYL